MSPRHKTPVTHANSFPRVSGDEPVGLIAAVKAFPFSPRERG